MNCGQDGIRIHEESSDIRENCVQEDILTVPFAERSHENGKPRVLYNEVVLMT